MFLSGGFTEETETGSAGLRRRIENEDLCNVARSYDKVKLEVKARWSVIVACEAFNDLDPHTAIPLEP